MSLIFNHPMMKNDQPNTNRWHSECGRYAMAVYRFKNDKPCKPYYIGYSRRDGRRLTIEHTDIIACARALRHVDATAD